MSQIGSLAAAATLAKERLQLAAEDVDRDRRRAAKAGVGKEGSSSEAGRGQWDSDEPPNEPSNKPAEPSNKPAQEPDFASPLPQDLDQQDSDVKLLHTGTSTGGVICC